VPFVDLPVEELRRYRPRLSDPENFDAFWANTLSGTRAYDLAVSVQPVQTGLTVVDTFDVRYAGFGGAPIAAWLHLPARAEGPLPAVVEYVGYGGGRGLPTERFLWAAAGYAHLVMDIRSQGSGWSTGDTPDPPDPDAGLS
jgi:cephalosporin-C deacetylase